MAHPILMPKPGQMTEECTLVAWHKREGDPVKKGDVLFEIETDKSNMDVEAFEEGVLLKRVVEEGQTVAVNAVCAYVGEPGEAIPDAPPAQPAAQPQAARAAEPAPVAASPAPTPVQPATARVAPVAPIGGENGMLRISPRASKLAAASGLDPRTIAGTGPEGRITERDVRAALEAPVQVAPAAPAAPVPAAAQTAPVVPAVPAPAAAFYDSAGEEAAPQPMSRMRRVIAERLTHSVTTAPQFTVTVAVDMTRLVTLRTELKAAGTALTVTDFIVSAAAQSLVEFPIVNARTDGVSIWQRPRVHMGLAVSLPDPGSSCR